MVVNLTSLYKYSSWVKYVKNSDQLKNIKKLYSTRCIGATRSYRFFTQKPLLLLLIETLLSYIVTATCAFIKIFYIHFIIYRKKFKWIQNNMSSCMQMFAKYRAIFFFVAIDALVLVWGRFFIYYLLKKKECFLELLVDLY